MKYLAMMSFLFFFAAGCVWTPTEALAATSGERRIALPKPETTGGKPLMEAMARRHADRNFSDKPVSEQMLSNILWAAWGINRPDGRRTVPTAMNRQKMDVYAVLESGVWRYDATANELVLALAEDARATYGGAPVTLLYAVPADDAFGPMHAGSAYQNVGLFCASAGLANVVKQSGKDALKASLKLPAGYAVVIVQSMGWPR